MATMNISLPDAMKDWVEAQVQTGRYGNSSDYVRDLVRRDQELKEARNEFYRLIDEGFASGLSEQTVEEVFEEARQEFLASDNAA